MSDESKKISELDEKIENLSKEMAGMKEALETLSVLSDIDEKVGSMEEKIEDVTSQMEPVSKVDDLLKSVADLEKAIDKSDTSKGIETLDKKIDGLSKNLNALDKEVSKILDAKETEVMFKKIDDVLIAVTDLKADMNAVAEANESDELEKKTDSLLEKMESVDKGLNELKGEKLDVLEKKIEDMQQYVAGLSVLEERLDEMSVSFSETKEIVSIIVRQLDDIERKYNKTIEDLSEALDKLDEAQVNSASPKKKPPEEKTASAKESEAESPIQEELPSNIDGLMANLKNLVNPKTEAKEMARALEQVRDKLTTLIEGHTPVLFQFGKRARELKSYPATATLNENDIARLNKDLREWSKKLEKV
jgi:chromosome segregation ATPase